MLFTFNVITVAVSGGTRFKHFEKLFAHRSWGRMKDEEFEVRGSGLGVPPAALEKEGETDTHAGHIHNLARHLDNINVCSLALSAAPSAAPAGKPKRIRLTDTLRSGQGHPTPPHHYCPTHTQTQECTWCAYIYINIS